MAQDQVASEGAAGEQKKWSSGPVTRIYASTLLSLAADSPPMCAVPCLRRVPHWLRGWGTSLKPNSPLANCPKITVAVYRRNPTTHCPMAVRQCTGGVSEQCWVPVHVWEGGTRIPRRGSQLKGHFNINFKYSG